MIRKERYDALFTILEGLVGSFQLKHLILQLISPRFRVVPVGAGGVVFGELDEQIADTNIVQKLLPSVELLDRFLCFGLLLLSSLEVFSSGFDFLGPTVC